MTRLSQFSQAAKYVESLRRLRRFREAYGNCDSPPRRVIISLADDKASQQQQQHLLTTTGPDPVILSASIRSELNKALDHEEASLTAELRSLGLIIDIDGPL